MISILTIQANDWLAFLGTVLSVIGVIIVGCWQRNSNKKSQSIDRLHHLRSYGEALSKLYIYQRNFPKRCYSLYLEIGASHSQFKSSVEPILDELTDCSDAIVKSTWILKGFDKKSTINIDNQLKLINIMYNQINDTLIFIDRFSNESYNNDSKTWDKNMMLLENVLTKITQSEVKLSPIRNGISPNYYFNNFCHEYLYSFYENHKDNALELLIDAIREEMCEDFLNGKDNRWEDFVKLREEIFEQKNNDFSKVTKIAGLK